MVSPDSLLLLTGFSLLNLWYIIIGILGFVVAFGIAVFVHELGHFAAAKYYGVKVDRFCIGMDKEAIPFLPKAIVEYRYGDTTYALSLVPLGGYVKMAGVVHPEIERYLDGDAPKKETVPDSAARLDGEARPSSSTLQGQAYQDMEALYKKPFRAKFLIYSAGVIMNILTAMVLMAVLLTMGMNVSAPLRAQVGYLPEGNPYEQMGVQLGDRVVSVNGIEVANANQMFEVIFRGVDQDTTAAIDFQMTLVRELTDELHTIKINLPLQGEGASDAFQMFRNTFVLTPPFIEATLLNDVADKAGIRPGDLITAIDGQPIRSFFVLRDAIERSLGVPVLLTVVRDGQPPFDVTVVPAPHSEFRDRGMIGIVPGNKDREWMQLPFTEAVMVSPQRVITLTSNYIQNLGQLFGKAVQGNTTAVRRELGGPVAIGQMAYRQAQRGLSEWLRFLIILNVALAVMNALPIPVLDGGHICFAIYEKIVGKPVPPQILLPILNGAVIFILLLFLLITFNDLFKIFS